MKKTIKVLASLIIAMVSVFMMGGCSPSQNIPDENNTVLAGLAKIKACSVKGDGVINYHPLLWEQYYQDMYQEANLSMSDFREAGLETYDLNTTQLMDAVCIYRPAEEINSTEKIQGIIDNAKKILEFEKDRDITMIVSGAPEPLTHGGKTAYWDPDLRKQVLGDEKCNFQAGIGLTSPTDKKNHWGISADTIVTDDGYVCDFCSNGGLYEMDIYSLDSQEIEHYSTMLEGDIYTYPEVNNYSFVGIWLFNKDWNEESHKQKDRGGLASILYTMGLRPTAVIGQSERITKKYYPEYRVDWDDPKSVFQEGEILHDCVLSTFYGVQTNLREYHFGNYSGDGYVYDIRSLTCRNTGLIRIYTPVAIPDDND